MTFQKSTKVLFLCLAGILTGILVEFSAISSAFATKSIETPVDGEMQSLLHVKSSAELAQLGDQSRIRKRLQLECDMQSTARVPTACFALLQEKLKRREVENDEYEAEWQKWSQVCNERAAKSSDERELARLGRQLFVPADCREIGHQRRIDLIYMASNHLAPNLRYLDSR